MSSPPPHRSALVVGKFCPLHLGHLALIERALEVAERVHVLTYTSLSALGCEAPQRQRWLDQLLAPHAHRAQGLALSPELCPADEESAEVHRAFCAERSRALGWEIDVVVTSEGYGEGFAQTMTRLLGRPVAHECFDPERVALPLSGTLMRAAFERLTHAKTESARLEALETLRAGLPSVVFESLTMSLSELVEGESRS